MKYLKQNTTNVIKIFLMLKIIFLLTYAINIGLHLQILDVLPMNLHVMIEKLHVMIKKGRHLGIDRTFRNCPICLKRNVYVIEDEFHFMMVRSEYEHLRNKLFPYEAFSNLSLNSFYKVMKTKYEIIN